jgi:FolB domain-containing protein
MADLILIRKLGLDLKIGCGPEERLEAQRVELDVEVELSAAEAAESKNLVDTVCYLTLTEWYRELTEKREWTLIEELIEFLATETLSRYSVIQSICLEARKFVVPGTESVGVRIRRSR